MKRSARRPAKLAHLGLMIAVAAVALTGCALGNPTTISTPYPAGDGSNGTISDPAGGSSVTLQNFLLVSAGQGQPGTLVGAITNDGDSSVTVNVTLYKDDAAVTSSSASGQATAEVPAGGMVILGQPGATASASGQGPSGSPSLVLGSTPQPPGALLVLRAETAAGGSVQITIPVLAPDGEYSSLTPTAGPTAS